ncbi:Transcription factor [Aspergillus sclerotialis]|uniref:Transcription factor n=1 Tax=Aspergillus sclerotialis TaxID=2070753 RepID=A0A3A2ZBS5_9EURO|nr:Transcription factor [Aspergillus sclerotialis]
MPDPRHDRKAPLTRRSGNAHRQGRDMLLDQNGGSSIEAAGDFFHGNGAQAEYLGSTSFVSALPEPMPGILDSSSFHPDEADTMRLSIAKPRLARFFHFSGQLQELITRYYNRSQFLIIPRPLILDPISKISDSLKDAEDENLSPFESVWTHLMANLTKPLSAVADTITADEFYGWFTGSNLRWEFVGVISALAGLASSYPETREVFDHEALTVPEMLTVSNICLETCEQHNRMNDLTVWLRYTNFTLASSLYGDTKL